MPGTSNYDFEEHPMNPNPNLPNWMVGDSFKWEKCELCEQLPCICDTRTEQEDPDKQYGDDDGYGEHVNYPSL